MKNKSQALRLILVGAVHRLGLAAFVIAVLWLGFVWATQMPGAL